MVCQGFKAPDYIDPKFLDPKYALADVDQTNEDVEGTTQKITSLKKLLAPTKRARGGYDNTRENLLYDEADMIDFLESQDPYEFLTKCNKVSNIQFIFSSYLSLGYSSILIKKQH